MNLTSLPNLLTLSSDARRSALASLCLHFTNKLRDSRTDSQRLQHTIATYRAAADQSHLPPTEAATLFDTLLLRAGFPPAEADTARAFYHEDPDSPTSPPS